jgi:hypothetical protein
MGDMLVVVCCGDANATVLREGPYTFAFFASDGAEPRHIHVKRDRLGAKFWLQPVSVSKNTGFPEHELREIERGVVHHQAMFVRAWDDFFGP